jgi:hypothetical protein
MSAERALSPARLAAIGLIAATAGCAAPPPPYVAVSKDAPDASRTAAVRLAPCGTAWCEGLWLGTDAASATLLATLAPDREHAGEIAWSNDSRRVAFLINGQQLRIYDAQTRAPAGQLDLVPADATPSTRIARGVTFSDNGAAITFDDCPRYTAGCRPGLVAVR